MNSLHRISHQFIWIGLLLTLSGPGWSASGITESSLVFGRFGKVALYSPPAEPDQAVLFISGDGGWNLGVVDMARELAWLDALVVGIATRHFLKSMEATQDQCAYPAADFEALGQFVQKKLGYRTFHRPVLVGYSLMSSTNEPVRAEFTRSFSRRATRQKASGHGESPDAPGRCRAPKRLRHDSINRYCISCLLPLSPC